MRLARLFVLVFGLGCHARVLGVAESGTVFYEPDPEPLKQSNEPFVENPRFCLPEVAFIGNECRVQPTPC